MLSDITYTLVVKCDTTGRRPDITASVNELHTGRQPDINASADGLHTRWQPDINANVDELLNVATTNVQSHTSAECIIYLVNRSTQVDVDDRLPLIEYYRSKAAASATLQEHDAQVLLAIVL